MTSSSPIHHTGLRRRISRKTLHFLRCVLPEVHSKASTQPAKRRVSIDTEGSLIIIDRDFGPGPDEGRDTDTDTNTEAEAETGSDDDGKSRISVAVGSIRRRVSSKTMRVLRKVPPLVYTKRPWVKESKTRSMYALERPGRAKELEAAEGENGEREAERHELRPGWARATTDLPGRAAPTQAEIDDLFRGL